MKTSNGLSKGIKREKNKHHTQTSSGKFVDRCDPPPIAIFLLPSRSMIVEDGRRRIRSLKKLFPANCCWIISHHQLPVLTTRTTAQPSRQVGSVSSQLYPSFPPPKKKKNERHTTPKGQARQEQS